MLAVSAMSDSQSNNILRGRPFGDIAVMWRRCNLFNTQSYRLLNCSRCKGLSFKTSEAFYFVFDVYLPCLSKFGDEPKAEVMECMSFIEDTVANNLNKFIKNVK